MSSSVPPLEAALCKLDDDDIREMEEKCEGGGEVPSKRRECDAIELSFDATLDDCGVKERRRETVGCRNGLASLNGYCLESGEETLDSGEGVLNEEALGGRSKKSSSVCCCMVQVLAQIYHYTACYVLTRGSSSSV